jgi:hypothetical protein
LQGFLEDEFFLEALPGHLLPDQANQGRRSIILERVKKLLSLAAIEKTTHREVLPENDKK